MARDVKIARQNLKTAAVLYNPLEDQEEQMTWHKILEAKDCNVLPNIGERRSIFRMRIQSIAEGSSTCTQSYRLCEIGISVKSALPNTVSGCYVSQSHPISTFTSWLHCTEVPTPRHWRNDMSKRSREGANRMGRTNRLWVYLGRIFPHQHRLMEIKQSIPTRLIPYFKYRWVYWIPLYRIALFPIAL